ncbi:elongation factor G C-terminus domain-containing protein [Cardiosporidium cionae]|uniref:Elongation factor G C-terminus domain-containing protein n=1 Tax=Cardiosporidium cionae TaxID=476202 RepID=A0ABQ7J9L8_9APIC|nr:elongation factor G C-terminus domain-containing protein [Cardiosporidium cionae]|eukprot:KAF8820345.1 elongation factor G C-terminus domain-containing protein [Cardiosporidium cionae]
MGEPSIDRLRTFGVFAHIDAGKTSTVECLLYQSKEIAQRGSILDGTTQMDFLPQEKERGITIQSAVTTFYWKKHQMNVIDTPGHVDFTEEVTRAITALDSAIVVLDGMKGVEAQTESIWRQLNAAGNPSRLIFINKMDREGFSMEHSLSSIRSRLHCIPLPIHAPLPSRIGYEDMHTKKIVNLIENKIYSYPCDARSMRNILTSRIEEVPTLHISMKKEEYTEWESIYQRREKLFEEMALLDDEFAEIFLNSSSSIDVSLLWQTLRRITLNSLGIPIVCGSALQNMAIEELLDSIVAILPSPLDRKPPKVIDASSLSCKNFQKLKKQKNEMERTHRFKQIPSAAKKIFCRTSQNEIKMKDYSTLSILIFKVLSDRKGGRLAFCRIMSGILKYPMTVFNSTQSTVETISGIFRVKADRFSKCSMISAGDMAMIRGCKSTVAGDTLIEIDCDESQNAFEIHTYAQLTPAVCFCAFIPFSSQDEERLMLALKEIQLSDKSLRIDTENEFGQILVWGVGELHIEIVRQRLAEDYGLLVEVGEMEIAYKEYIETENEAFIQHKMSVNGKLYSIGMTLRVSPLSLPALKETLFESSNVMDEISHITPTVTDPPSYENHIDLNEAIQRLSNLSREGIASSHRLISDAKLEEIQQTLRQTLEDSFMNGPLIGSPIVNGKLTVIDLQVEASTPLGVIKACTSQLFQKVMNSTSSTLLEPVMRLHVLCDTSTVGNLVNDLTRRRRGHIQHMQAFMGADGITEASTSITAIVKLFWILGNLESYSRIVPLKSMMGYSGILRSLTHGKASFQMTRAGFEKLPEVTLTDVLQRKGIYRSTGQP